MAYTALKLITGAYYASGIRARDFETVSGSDVTDGLQFLNEIMQDDTTDYAMIPYYTKYEFDAVAGQQTYFIEDLIDVDTLVFFIDSVRYSMGRQSRKLYHGSPRAENIRSLPFNYEVDRCLGGANVNMYFLPDQDYPMELWGQFRLPVVTSLSFDLSTIFDQFYITYLRYFLAGRLCHEFNVDVPMGVTKQIAIHHKAIAKRSAPLDLTTTVISTVNGSMSLNYGQVNIGRGFTTGSANW